MSMRNSGQLLKRLRSLMKNGSKVNEGTLNAYYVEKNDAHGSEYLAACDERVAFISGFTGSKAEAIVTMDEALIWVDGRYHLQADKQVFSSWTVMKMGLKEVPTPQEWINKTMPAGSRIGFDPCLISHRCYTKMKDDLVSHHLIAMPKNLIDVIWEDKPPMPSNPITPYPTSLAGQSWPEKIEKIRKELTEKKVIAMALTMLDEIAWLFNLRGSDIDYNPLFFAYTVITMDNV